MFGLAELIIYATSHGFWVFAGVVIILAILAEVIVAPLKVAALALAHTLTSITKR